MTRSIARFEARVKGARVAPSQVDVNREGILARCGDLERLCPDAVEVAAEAGAALHTSINGRAADLAGNRPPKYFRRQLRSEEAFTTEDLSRLAIQAPAEFCAWLLPVLKATAHGAPMQMAAVLAHVISVVDERLQQTREQLAGVEALTRKVPWNKVR